MPVTNKAEEKQFYIRTTNSTKKINGKWGKKRWEKDGRAIDFSEIYLLKRHEEASIEALQNCVQNDVNTNNSICIHETNTEFAKLALEYISERRRTEPGSSETTKVVSAFLQRTFDGRDEERLARSRSTRRSTASKESEEEEIKDSEEEETERENANEGVGLEDAGQSCSHNTHGSSARSSEHILNPDSGPTASFGQRVYESLGNYDVVRLRVFPHKKESRSALRWPVWSDETMTTFKVLVYVGEECKLTANDLVMGATFVNMSKSIKANRMLRLDCRDLIATFQLPLTDEDQKLQTVPVKVRFSPNAEVCDCTIVFNVTNPLRYTDPELVLKPKKENIFFDLEAQPSNCRNQSPEQMGKFSLHLKEEDTKNPVLLDCKWLELHSTSGQLKVKMEDLPKDPDKRTQIFCITRKNRMGEMEKFELVIEFVNFSFIDIPHELINGQALDSAILLASTPDILSELGVSIKDIGDLSKYGFKISGGKLEIVGTPTADFDCPEHKVTICCPGVSDISLKLLLPRVESWKSPCLTPGTARITKCNLDKIINKIKNAAAEQAAKQESYQFHNYVEHNKLFKMRSPGYYELTLMMGIETEVQIDFDLHRLSTLEKVKVELYRFVPKNDMWVLRKNDTDVSIKVENGHLVIAGNPRAHTDDKKWQIDDSGQRCWHNFAIITPQNMAADGEVVRLMITCRPLKIFWGIAQTYNFESMPTSVHALDCCKVDLDNMIADHRLLGFDIILSCCDTAGGCIDITRRHVESLVAAVVTADIVSYMSGHGCQSESGKTYLLVRDDLFSADWDSTHNNLCIQDTAEAIASNADNSTFLVLIVDACREIIQADTSRKKGWKKGLAPISAFKLKISKLFQQHVIWQATSAGLLSMVEPGKQGMSRFTGCLHSALTEVVAGMPEMMKPTGSDHFVAGMIALKNWVHRAVRDRVLEHFKSCTDVVEAQAPDYHEGKVQEAFTFKLIPFPPLPPTLGVVPLHDCSDGTDLRWKTLWEEKKISEDDYIAYSVGSSAITISGQVQGDSRIKCRVRNKDMLFIDAVAFAMQDNTWASPDHHDQSVIDTNEKLFACCHLCQGDDGTSLEDLLSSCGSHAASAVLGGIGNVNSSGKGKESYYYEQLHTDQVEGVSGEAQVRKRALEDSPQAPSKYPMVIDVCMWVEYEIQSAIT